MLKHFLSCCWVNGVKDTGGEVASRERCCWILLWNSKVLNCSCLAYLCCNSDGFFVLVWNMLLLYETEGEETVKEAQELWHGISLSDLEQWGMNTAGCNLLPAIQIQGLAGTMEQETVSDYIFSLLYKRAESSYSDAHDSGCGLCATGGGQVMKDLVVEATSSWTCHFPMSLWLWLIETHASLGQWLAAVAIFNEIHSLA